MAFMALFGWLIPVIVLFGAVKMALEALLGPLEPLLNVLLEPAVFRGAAAVLLAVNLLALAALLAARAWWKRTGRLSRAYIRRFRGWKRLGLEAAGGILTLGAIWEFLAVLACAGCLLFPPSALLRALIPGSPAPQAEPRHPYFGTWRVVSCIGTSPFCPLSQEEIDACIGLELTYPEQTFTRDGTVYLKELETFTSGGASYRVLSEDYTAIGAEEFEAEYRLSPAGLGVETPVLTRIVLELEGEDGPDAVPGQVRFSPGRQMWTCFQGSFFLMERAE